jgi:hypothetical protein
MIRALDLYVMAEGGVCETVAATVHGSYVRLALRRRRRSSNGRTL